MLVARRAHCLARSGNCLIRELNLREDRGDDMRGACALPNQEIDVPGMTRFGRHGPR